MTDKKRVRRYAGPRPVNPGQHELQITNRLMEDAIIRARTSEQREQETKLLLAGILSVQPDKSVTLFDKDMALLENFAGFETSRDEAGKSLTLSLIEFESPDEEAADEAAE